MAAWGVMEQADAGYVIVGLLGPNLDLVLRTLKLLPLDVMLGQ